MMRSSGLLSLSGVLLATAFSCEAENHEIFFDANLLRGMGLSQQDLQRLDHDTLVKPGIYSFDVYLNQQPLAQEDVTFSPDGAGVTPCFSRDLLDRLGLTLLPMTRDEKCYRPSSTALQAVSVSWSLAQARLDFSIPQSLLHTLPRGSVDESQLDAGETMLQLNYMVNQYRVTQREQGNDTSDSTYLSLNGGFNLGLWRYRQQSTLNYDTDYGSRWTTARRYVQRAVLPLRSELTLGEGFTDGQFFSGMSFRGVQIASDQRMRPDSQRGYAPVVRGIAHSNAKVVIRQGNISLYETTVAPGAFEINDLYPTNFAGDLTAIVTEADGSESTFSVPFSALPESIRAGQFEYSATVGRVRDVGDDDVFSEIVWQKGINNALTLNMGNQLANGFQAMMLGSVYSSSMGAVGVDSTFSHAEVMDNGWQSGWMFRINYSKFFPQTGTSVALAGYRYSTGNYVELYDVLGARNAVSSGDEWQSGSWRQRSRVELSASQTMDVLGSLNLSVSTQDYRDSKGRDKQLQISWNKTFANGISLSLAGARTHRLAPDTTTTSRAPTWQAESQTMWSLSMTMPIGSSRYSPLLSISANHMKDEEGSYQTTLSGQYGEYDPLSYSLNYATDEKGGQSVWGGNVQKNFPWANGAASVSVSPQYWQASTSLQGGLVAHRGGITLGPYIGDTFALVDAPGADGAKIMGGQGATVNRFGHGLAPALMPYQYNVVSLDPQNMNDQAELQTTQQRVAPSAGAMVRLRFATLRGQAMLITALREGTDPIPLGAAAYDEYGNSVGMVGQANQIYLRANGQKGTLQVKWGERAADRCRVEWTASPANEPLQLLSLPCR